tara:strand:- start:384 stop:584 length:201 start_codon:yes stop_codon:yes gene_type:complete
MVSETREILYGLLQRGLAIMKLQQMNGKQFFLTLPNQIIRAKGWKKGDRIKVVIDNKGDIVLKKEE